MKFDKSKVIGKTIADVHIEMVAKGRSEYPSIMSMTFTDGTGLEFSPRHIGDGMWNAIVPIFQRIADQKGTP